MPGGFAERARARACVELPAEVDDARATLAEPLACVLRGAERVPRGRVLVVGCGFVGLLFLAVLRRRGDEVFALEPRPERLLLSGARPPDDPVDAAVVCAPGGGADALAHLAPGGTLLAFASGGEIDLDLVYRRELAVLGSRSATPGLLREAVALLSELETPPLTVLPLERFEEGLERYRSGEAIKVVFTP